MKVVKITTLGRESFYFVRRDVYLKDLRDSAPYEGRMQNIRIYNDQLFNGEISLVGELDLRAISLDYGAATRLTIEGNHKTNRVFSSIGINPSTIQNLRGLPRILPVILYAQSVTSEKELGLEFCGFSFK